MNILKLCYEHPPIGGGGGQVVASLSQELARKGHQVDLVTMHYRHLPCQENRHGVIIHRVPSIRLSASVCRPAEMLSYLVVGFPFVLRLCKQKQFDINHTHFIYPDGILAYGLKKFLGLPYIITAHGSDVPGYNPDRFKALHKGLIPIWKRVVDGAEMIVSPSESLSHLIHEQVENLGVTVIPNGFKPRDLSLSLRDKPRVLIISRMFERKGIQHFLKALKDFTIPIIVDIIGDGPFLPELQQIATQISTEATINFHGWLDNDSAEFRSFLEQATIFVLPSEAENFPIVLLEAMSAKLAIITSAGTGCQEVVGDTGLLVKPGDEAGLRQALRQLLEDPHLCNRLGELAHQRAEGLFGWSRIADQYLGVYHKVLKLTGCET